MHSLFETCCLHTVGLQPTHIFSLLLHHSYFLYCCLSSHACVMSSSCVRHSPRVWTCTCLCPSTAPVFRWFFFCIPALHMSAYVSPLPHSASCPPLLASSMSPSCPTPPTNYCSWFFVRIFSRHQFIEGSLGLCMKASDTAALRAGHGQSNMELRLQCTFLFCDPLKPNKESSSTYLFCALTNSQLQFQDSPCKRVSVPVASLC